MYKDKATRAVSIWIFVGLFMLIIQVLLGGITRLTGSGLSITEWKPIIGAIPPLNAQVWEEAFSQYKQIAQYKYINQHFSMSDFKFIYFWEWFHRLWARLIGVVFLIPFILFLIKKYFKSWMIGPLVILFVLGGLQGAVGWIMVKSGLNDADIYVSHIRLAAHFMAAMILIAYTLIFGLKLTIEKKHYITNAKIFNVALIICILISIQLIYGAFMAGLKAAVAAPTWPSINGEFMPENFSEESNGWAILQNKLVIHFIHRNLAYLLAAIIFIWWFLAKKINSSPLFYWLRNGALALVFIQIALGIATVTSANKVTINGFGFFEWMALMHQLTGMLLFLLFVSITYLSMGKKESYTASKFNHWQLSDIL